MRRKIVELEVPKPRTQSTVEVNGYTVRMRRPMLFRRYKCTRDTAEALRCWRENSTAGYRQVIHGYCVDYKDAFDRVDFRRLIHALRKSRWNDTRLLSG